jgi:hypothetical protein
VQSADRTNKWQNLPSQAFKLEVNHPHSLGATDPYTRDLGHTVNDRVFLIVFHSSGLRNQLVFAARIERHDERLAFITSEGKLAGLFMRAAVHSWHEISET